MAHDGFMIETRRLRKVYVMGQVRVPALRGVDLKVKRGEYVSIVGPSGCGKSTLLNLLGALDRPSGGRIIVDGIDISMLNDRKLAVFRNRKIGFVFQSYNLINRSSTLRNVEIPAIVMGKSERERRTRAYKLLKLVGLEDKAERKPTELSGGEQQRVAIARALINDPAIILADEPTGNLDTKTGAEIDDLMHRINKERCATIVMVTHNMDLADDTDRIIHLRDGLIEKTTIGV